jgi:hypothetical protein
MTSPSLQPLKLVQLTSGAGDAVLFVDFAQFSSGRLLSEELSECCGDRAAYRIDPVTDLAGDQAYWPFGALADGYVEACLALGLNGRRVSVVGYCSAAALSLGVAARLAGQAAPVLVLPTWPDVQMIAADFRCFRTELGARSQSLPDMTGAPSTVLRRMEDVLRGDLDAMAAAYSLDQASPNLGEMLARYRAWLGFLISTADALRWHGPPGLRPRVVLGSDSRTDMPGFAADAYEVIRLPVPEEDLLGCDELAASVLARPQPGS